MGLKRPSSSSCSSKDVKKQRSETKELQALKEKLANTETDLEAAMDLIRAQADAIRTQGDTIRTQQRIIDKQIKNVKNKFTKRAEDIEYLQNGQNELKLIMLALLEKLA